MPVGTNEILISKDAFEEYKENLYSNISRFVYKYGYVNNIKNNIDDTMILDLDYHGFYHDKVIQHSEHHRCDLDHDVNILIRPKNVAVNKIKRIILSFTASSVSLYIPYNNSLMNKDGILLTIHPLYKIPDTDNEYELPFTFDDNEFRIYTEDTLSYITKQLEYIILKFEVDE
jgi:hypothetical protein